MQSYLLERVIPTLILYRDVILLSAVLLPERCFNGKQTNN